MHKPFKQHDDDDDYRDRQIEQFPDAAEFYRPPKHPWLNGMIHAWKVVMLAWFVFLITVVGVLAYQGVNPMEVLTPTLIKVTLYITLPILAAFAWLRRR